MLLAVLLTTNGKPVDTEGRSRNRAAEFQVAGDFGNVEEKFLQISRDSNFSDRIGELAAGNPHSGCATGIVARDKVHALTKEFGDVEAFLNPTDKFLRQSRAR